MGKEEVYGLLSAYEKNSILKAVWKGRNGVLDSMVRFEGFDKNKKPFLIQPHGVPLDLEQLDNGYDSVVSFSLECPDGYCVCQKNIPATFFPRVRESPYPVESRALDGTLLKD
jgi:hypothetical protein